MLSSSWKTFRSIEVNRVLGRQKADPKLVIAVTCTFFPLMTNMGPPESPEVVEDSQW